MLIEYDFLGYSNNDGGDTPRGGEQGQRDRQTSRADTTGSNTRRGSLRI